jgi:RNA polymerase sigma factor (sigma-70 family)
MTQGAGAQPREDKVALIVAARPELHRYASRMLGSSFDGEDAVQDVAERALAALDDLAPDTPFKPWLFRVLHNRVIDLLRSRAGRSELIAGSLAPDDDATETPHDILERQETVSIALTRFVRLPVAQRSVLILSDVLDLSASEIVETLGLTLPAIKAQLHRARRAIRDAAPEPASDPVRPGPETVRYAELFNNRDWNGLKALLAEEVRVVQHAKVIRVGRESAGATFLGAYSRLADWRLEPARAEGQDIMAVFDPATQALIYVTRAIWREGRIAEIHDYRYARYVLEGLVVA